MTLFLENTSPIALTASTEAGRRYGLLSLAQMMNGAFADPKFQFPATGGVEDAPRYDWPRYVDHHQL